MKLGLDRDRHAPARAAHREDPGPPGHRGGAAPARAHRASWASTSRAPSGATRRACSAARYEIARLGRLGVTVHAGEDAPAEYVWEAIDDLGATAHRPRLLAAAQTPSCMRRLAQRPHPRRVLPVEQRAHRRGEARHAPSHPRVPGSGRARRHLLRQHHRLAHRPDAASPRARRAGDRPGGGRAHPPPCRRAQLHPAGDGVSRKGTTRSGRRRRRSAVSRRAYTRSPQ